MARRELIRPIDDRAAAPRQSLGAGRFRRICAAGRLHPPGTSPAATKLPMVRIMAGRPDLSENAAGSFDAWGDRSVSKFRTILYLAAILTLPIALGGCPVAIVGGIAAAGGAGYAANQERGVGGGFSDFAIKTNIQNAWIKTNPAMQADLEVTVYQGRVLLTGNAPTPEMKSQAQQMASSVPGVRTVYNEIEVAPPETAWNSTKDAWITSRVRSNLVFNSHIRSVNYTVETADRSVYLIGSARSQAELDSATDMARYVPGVKRVVSYVEIRPGMPAGAAPTAAMPPPAASEPSAGSPSAAPTTPVEAQKL
jgi:osmotically-inducible protein OsmY